MADEKLEILITVKDEASKAFASIGEKANKVLASGMKYAAGGAVALGGALVAATKWAMDAELVQANLAQTIRSTGGVAGWSADEANALADQLASVTRYSDETIVSAQAMLLTFTNIGEDVMPAATEALLNMGEKFGSVDSAAIQLGKALNDPIAGVAALREVGVSLTEEQEELVRSLVESGDMAGAQKVILDELGVEVGGLARAYGDTAAGKIAIATNKMKDLAQVVGSFVLPLVADLASTFATAVSNFLPRFTDSMGRIIKYMRLFGVDSKIARRELGRLFGKKLGNLIADVVVGFDKLKTVMQDLIGAVVPFIQQHSKALLGALAGIATLLLTAAIAFKIMSIGAALTTLISPIGLIVAAAALLGMAWTTNFLGIRDIVKQVFEDYLVPAFGKVKELIAEALPTALAFLRQQWDSVFKPLGAIAKFLFDNEVVPAIMRAVEWFKDFLPQALAAAKDAWNNVLKPALLDLWDFTTNTLIPKLQDFARMFAETLVQVWQAARDAWNNTLKPALQAIWDFVNTTLLPKLQEFSGWFLNTLANAFTTARQNWNDVLKPALQAIWDFVQTTLLPKVLEFSSWFTNTLGSAFTTARQNWNDVLKPALQAIWDFVSDTLLPKVKEFSSWFTDTLSSAYSEAKTAWDNTLKPALEAVTTFIADTVMPQALSFSNWFMNALSSAYTNARTIWTNILKPAWDTIVTFVSTILLPNVRTFSSWFTITLGAAYQAALDGWNNILKPAFDTLIGFVNDTLLPALTTVSGWFETGIQLAWDIGAAVFEKIKEAFNNLLQPIQEVINIIGEVGEQLGKLDDWIPDWLRPGSPTPFEIGIRGISKSMRELARVPLPKLELVAPTLADVAVPQQLGRAAQQGFGRSSTNNYYLTVNAGGDYQNALSDFNMMRAWSG